MLGLEELHLIAEIGVALVALIAIFSVLFERSVPSFLGAECVKPGCEP